MIDRFPATIQPSVDAARILKRRSSHDPPGAMSGGAYIAVSIHPKVMTRRVAAIARFRRNCECQRTDQQGSQGDSFREGPFCRMHWFILHAWFRRVRSGCWGPGQSGDVPTQGESGRIVAGDSVPNEVRPATSNQVMFVGNPLSPVPT